jgi:Zn-dependent peptidase ImmA (M78 family)
LYHEIFHILAHSKATPVFKKIGCHREGIFNEMLADHFSSACLVPEKLARKTWPMVKDINKMTELFDVPAPIMWLGLKLMHLS